MDLQVSMGDQQSAEKVLSLMHVCLTLLVWFSILALIEF